MKKINPNRELGHQFSRNRDARVKSYGRYIIFYTEDKMTAEDFLKLLKRNKRDYKWMSFSQKENNSFKVIYKVIQE